ncbi:MAG: hypothetical protein B6I36_07695 [Desulfobacteraceae bacterium 4572_35.1]|nr:MAG: hypothetical protein B6I36_07695 [Desulfobacteraceae bacterium 4572_35.1]
MQVTLEQNSVGVSLGTTLFKASFGLGGSAGLSAYQIWKGQGNVGGEQDFLDSLKPETSSTGQTVEVQGALNASEDPDTENPYMTTSATESSITTQRVDYDALVAATLSI